MLFLQKARVKVSSQRGGSIRKQYTSICNGTWFPVPTFGYLIRAESMPEHAFTFSERVYGIVLAIPVGRVTTYGLIARAMGSPRSARIVGWTLRFSRDELDVPAHRVVNRIGFLSGGWHFGHPDVMRDRLLAEGVPFRDLDEYIVDINACLWDPSDDSTLDWAFQYDGDDLFKRPRADLGSSSTNE